VAEAIDFYYVGSPFTQIRGGKMKSTYVFLLLAIVTTVATAQEWVDVWGPGMPTDFFRAHDLVVDRSGYVYVAGNGYNYGFPVIVKYSATGQRLWTRRFVSSLPNMGYETPNLALTSDGRVVVAGMGHYQPGWVIYAVACNSVGDSLWEWELEMSGRPYVSPPAVAADDSGNLYVAAPYADTSRNRNVAVVKLSPSGQQLWLNIYDGPHHDTDVPYAVAVDDSGSAYVACQVVNALGRTKPTILKYRSNGNLDWARMFGQEATADGAFIGVAVSRSGYVYAVGTPVGSSWRSAVAKYSLRGDSIWNVYRAGTFSDMCVDTAGNLYVTGNDSAVNNYGTWKFTPSGEVAWIHSYDGPAHGNDIANSIAVDRAGDVLVTGHSAGLTSTDLTTIKYSSAGAEQWVARYCYHEYAEGIAIGTDPSRNVYVAGYSYDSVGSMKSVWVTAKYLPNGPGIQDETSSPRLPECGGIRVLPTVVTGRCHFALPARVRATGLRILDAAGKAVREVPIPAGESAAVWDATDEAGRPVPNGVYFVTLEGAGSRSATKFIIQR
jgi:hypothetical protein